MQHMTVDLHGSVPTKHRHRQLTSWWRKSSNMTVGQSSLIFVTHRCYDWHPGSRCGWTYNQLTSKVDGGITSTQVVNSHLVCDPTIQQPGFDLPWQQWSVLNRFCTEQGHCSVMPAEGNSDLQTLICILVKIPRWCPPLLNPVLWQSWIAELVFFIVFFFLSMDFCLN